jgi:dGTPase
MSVKGKKIISELFDFYFENPDCLPFDFSLAQTNIASSKSKQQLATLICDYIAGMTDRFAIKEHSQIQ